MAKATLKQKAAFNNTLEAVKTGKDVSLNKIMLKSGFSEATAKNPEKNLLSKQGWQDMLAQINDQEILNVFYKIMRDEDESGMIKDKDAAIKAAKELATLKDLYPATKSKIVGLFEKISSLE